MSASLDSAAPRLGSGAGFRKLSADPRRPRRQQPGRPRRFHRPQEVRRAGRVACRTASPREPRPRPSTSLSPPDAQGRHPHLPRMRPQRPRLADFGASGTSLDTSRANCGPPPPSTGYVRKGAPLTVTRGAAHALRRHPHAPSSSPPGAARRPHPGPDGRAGRPRRKTAPRCCGTATAAPRSPPCAKPDGSGSPTVNGRDLTPRDHQRTSPDGSGRQWNGAIRAAVRPPDGSRSQRRRSKPS